MAGTVSSPIGRTSDVGGLLAWLPLRALFWLTVVVLAVPATRMLLDIGHFVPGGLAIETDGEGGEIGEHGFSLTLPVRVYNGTSHTIYRVSLWVEAYACPSKEAALPLCRKLIAFEQDVPMQTAPKSSGWFTQRMTGGLPGAVPGQQLRILRSVQSVDDERDRERTRQATLPEPSLDINQATSDAQL